MKYFRDSKNEVSALRADGSQDSYIKPDMVLMSAAEVEVHINPPLTAAQIIEQHNAPILAQMDALDIKRIRPIAEGDTAYLATLNSKILALRATLK